MAKVPFTLTHVVFDEGDLLGYFLALVTLTPVFIVVSYLTLIVVSGFNRRLIYVFTGQLGNVAANVILKHIIKEPRPAAEHLTHFGRYGMPSNHSQFCFFTATFLLLVSINLNHLKNSRPEDSPILVFEPLHRNEYIFHAITFLICAAACIVAYSRVYLGYHTLSQVIVGCGIGITIASIWFMVLIFLRDKLSNRSKGSKEHTE
mmetsp:Transcript_6179/g.7107  ORF Transcript_6179/g.7107 Transcript_6179/m.7107 type:complete len:204 (-) Transcript_6179:1113-1724(-)